MYVKWFDTVIFYYVILVYLVNVTFCHFQISHQFRPPYVPTLAGNGTQMTGLQGTLQEGHRGSAGQGK
ncbi:unnamed protein product [Staurois parvus]|uniref:Uncharacterized protein n=1 Tax=Staurois parvus TaxID=386267 RepID=A0ABN9GN73_9NEOB|nr:unnamed protein product [Staurois parvus]